VNSKSQLVNGKPLGFINDLDVAKDGTIFFTSSSSKWKPSQLLHIMLEAETSGRYEQPSHLKALSCKAVSGSLKILQWISYERRIGAAKSLLFTAQTSTSE
jgi:hypothetical protein